MSKRISNYYPRVPVLLLALLLGRVYFAQEVVTHFIWPEGKRAALCLSFDDARLSQVDVGMAMLEQLLPYAHDRANGWCFTPVGTVAKYIRQQRNISR